MNDPDTTTRQSNRNGKNEGASRDTNSMMKRPKKNIIQVFATIIICISFRLQPHEILLENRQLFPSKISESRMILLFDEPTLVLKEFSQQSPLQKIIQCNQIQETHNIYE